jgi:hypothetical protein
MSLSLCAWALQMPSARRSASNESASQAVHWKSRVS